ncbi:Ser/Thr protein phosphatase family protein [Aulographum hederae CBS 113979]|uniref:Ser/Thr protein phosphatase family protein n=1 Tax=Aulographum hederae CBS 113979 TaxID=1176131 RepID=A0A6G1GM86_9PEZI|nr:Ser/Thr protein phosphatase family protein [Aulographum hederae CBS 113979]
MSTFLGYCSASPSQASISLPGASTFVAPPGFPTSAFSSYYISPASPTAEPQPAIYDPVLGFTYPLNLTDPNTIPSSDPDPIFFPVAKGHFSDEEAAAFVKEVVANVTSVITNGAGQSNCTVCKAALVAAKPAAEYAPSLVPDAMVELCTSLGLHSAATCEEDFTATTFGAIWTQVLYFADVAGLDGDFICNSLSSNFCPRPETSPLDTSSLFPKPKPANAKAPKASGKRVKVLHMSDFHLDPRYAVGSEANCTTGLCCRTNSNNSALPNGDISISASPYGYFECDTPYDLGLAALQAVGPMTGTKKPSHSKAKPQWRSAPGGHGHGGGPHGGYGKGSPWEGDSLAWTIYTGDLVSHDPQSELSRLYTEYAETSIYGMFKHYISGPVFAALGNHDSNPEAIDAPHSLPGPLGQQQSWNYDHVAGLWLHEGWLPESAATEARLHYGGYSVKNHFGLRIITFNSDFWYRSNFLNYINTTNPDNSGMFAFMISELQAAEDAGERVWIVAHVLSGWDGTNPLPNPSNLFYQIIDRYSPHVIANVFFGHTHEDQVMIYYSNNGTVQSADTALTSGWIMPSVTPLTNVNSGFRVYEVDTGDFNIYEAFTFYSNVSAYYAADFDPATTGPTFELEYSTREAYGGAANWPEDAPLNATFWHAVTEAMEEDPGLVETFNMYQGKISVQTPNCTNVKCVAAKICYMRSGSVALGSLCTQGFGSVQSAYPGS